MAELLQCLDYS